MPESKLVPSGRRWRDAEGDLWEELAGERLSCFGAESDPLDPLARWSMARSVVEEFYGPLVLDAPAPHGPRRDSDVAAWLKRKRDEYADPQSSEGGVWNARAAWEALDALLDDYRMHADTGVPLDSDENMGPTPEGVTDDA